MFLSFDSSTYTLAQRHNRKEQRMKYPGYTFKQKGDAKTYFCEEYWALTCLTRGKQSFSLINFHSNLTGNMLC